ncbi:hypothetical protein GCM10007424_06130 [Flavobacterium suaedae]|uniref:T9SS type A sorting domain-containing protein n=2 Tax=Flavobacterium suaedae TaxID=1767027 RepID=A0ABQ1JKD0_9FLAO|nr:hypothetical protein GCM10007424_06130 [Flavobacterium suaedae]
MLFSVTITSAQTTVFSDDFSTSTGSSYTSTNGAVGTSTSWAQIRSGTDMGARINSGFLTLTNDATGAGNSNGWILAYVSSASFSTPYISTLNNNPGMVTWTFNMRQIRSNPSGPANGSYANAFVLAGTSNTTATTGSGYAVLLGNNGKTDPLRLVRYTAGLRTSTNILSSNTSGLSDFGNTHLSVKVTYTPGSNTWELFVRQDGGTFSNPESGSLVSQGTAVNSSSTGTSLPLTGAFWNASTKKNQTAYFDNIVVKVTEPVITSLSPSSAIAGTGAFTLTVEGTDFTPSSTVRWNGSSRTTTYVSDTQLTASIPATDVTTAGSASVTVATGTATSNTLTFIIDPAATPSISTSTTALTSVTTVTGTASTTRSFTVTGANLTNNVTVAAPANFEVSTSSSSGFADSISLTQSGGTLTGQPVTVYSRIKASAPAGIYSGNIILSTTGGTNKQVAVSGKALALEPATSATNVTFNNVGASAFTVNFTAGSGTNRLVVLKQGSAVTAIPTDGTSYTASATFGLGSDIGSASYVVYNGTASSVTVTGLTASTSYHVAVFEFNGSAGTQNYKTTTPATGNRTTLNAPLGLQVATANTAYKVDFDSTVDGVNNGTYAGTGVSSVPESGELNSYSWAFTGFTDGAVNYGGDSGEDTVYDSGSSAGGETAGGIYAFEVEQGNYALGIQPSTGNFAPGSITFRFQNQTGSTITSLSVGYKVYVYNDEAGSNSLNLSYSSNNSTYTNATAVNHTTTAVSDAVPGWKAYYKVVTITGLNIATNNYGYLRWSGTTVSGTAFDEIALDDLVVVANPTTSFASFAGNAETFTVAGNAELSGNITVSGTTTFSNNSWLNLSSSTLTLEGQVINTTIGGLRGNGTGSLISSGTTNQTLSFDQTTPGTTNTFTNFTVSTTSSNTVTAGNVLNVSGILTIDTDQTLNMGSNALGGALSTISNDGTISSQNTSAAPWTSGRTWSGTGKVILNNSSSAQTLVPGTYNDVTISTPGGATTSGDVTVNGALNITVSNPSSSAGGLATGTNTLYMGGDATNTGIGEVSGIVTRNTGIISNKLYTFGNPYTSIRFADEGILPTSMSLKITPGTAPAGKTDAILRTYDFIQTGGSATKAVISARYQDSELNSNDENRLVDWVVVVSPLQTIEQSRTNYSTTNNYVELANVNVAFFESTFGNRLLTLADAEVATAVWNGSVSDSWTTAANWTPNATPSDNTNVIIPDAATTPNDPTLNPTVTIGTLSIEAGGIVNAPDDSQLIITGNNGAWINNGTFNPGGGTSTVTFNNTTADATIAGNTDFNNITIASGTLLRTLTNNQMNIAGTFTNSGTFISNVVENTVEYSGTNQTIVAPGGSTPAYHNLIISGTGAVFPTSLNIRGDLTLNQTVDFTGKTIAMTGTEAQSIGGTSMPDFNNLTINNSSADVSLAADVTVSGTLTLTTGLFNIGDYDLTLGANAVSGSFSSTTMIVADGDGLVRRPYTATGSYTFPVGEKVSNTTYSPIIVNVTSGTFSNAYVGVNVRDAVHPDNNSIDAYLTRYWNVTQTGITDAIANITATYVIGDAVGGEAALISAQLDGGFDVVSNPWVKFSALSGNTLTANNALLTEGQTSVFTGITAQNISAQITGEGTFCQDTEVTLTAEVTGGDAPYTYEWSNGLGSGETAIPPTDTAGTITYTLTVRDANGIASTDTADVVVTENPEAGTLSADQVICAGSTPSAITLSGFTGTVVRWERSITGTFTNPAFISSTSPTLTGAEMGSFTTTRYFRAVVQNGSCPVVYSNVVAVTITSTTWDGSTWSNGEPDATKSAIFNGDYTASADIEACTIQVNGTANVTIPSGFNVTVNGAITVSGGNFIVEDNANLLQLTNAVNSGNIIVYKNSSLLYRLDYTIWSSPVEGQNLKDFSLYTLNDRFYLYNSLTSLFETTDPTAQDFEPGYGYLIRMPNSDSEPGYNNGSTPIVFTGEFTGVPNNGDINVSVTTAGDAYNMLGNPYPSAINIHAFFDTNVGAINQSSALYFWRKRNNPDATTYATITKLAYTANDAEGGDTGSSTFVGDPSEWVINTGQGFFVQAESSSIVFTNDMRRAVNNGQFFRAPQTDEQPLISRLWLNLKDTQGLGFSQTAVGYTDETTTGIDYGWDGKLLSDGTIALYSLAEGLELSVQARNQFTIDDAVPLGFMVSEPGIYVIEADHFDGVFAEGQLIYIHDLYTETYTELSQGNTYEFNTDAGRFDNRFEVVYTAEALGNNDVEADPNTTFIYKQDQNLIVKSSSMLKSVFIYDIRGRLIHSKADLNKKDYTINNLVAEEQMLIIKLNTENGTIYKKLVY